MSRPVVLDSSALLTVFLGEPGSERVLPVLQDALLSTVNVAEVIARMIDLGAASEQVWSRIESLQCEVCLLTAHQARTAADLRSITRPFGLSLGDRACLALAIDRQAAVFTADAVWKSLSLGIEIQLIR